MLSIHPLFHPYLVVEKKRIVLYSSIIVQRIYQFNSFEDLRVEGNALYIQTEQKLEKINAPKFFVNQQDWKHLLETINSQTTKQHP